MQNPTDQEEKKPVNSFIRYSGIAMQMIVVIVAGSLGGKYLDEYLNMSFPVFTVVGVLFSVFAAVYLAIRDFLKK